ncbi:MAG: transglycosylase SLT domain-containing protein [Acidiferrobacterales bacterium]|nr:transglycosylase SLT domain-containing protein [Acidiferrobacterales bacterium]
MRILTLTILLLASLVSACSNKKTATETAAETVLTLPSTSSPTVSSPQQEDVIVFEPRVQTPVKTSTTASTTIATPTDVLDRIRRGFRFPELNSKYTQNYIDWSVEHPTYLSDLFARATPFLYYIVEEIDKRELPMELALIPAIESAYKPNAISRSNASGLWQFIPSTGRGFGLRQDWWYDGRRDFIESTNAALDYLSQLNKLFQGDWHLTLAAYNAGQGTVLRAINSNKRQGKNTNYQSLNLRTETVKYLPKLQAIKEIVSDPSRFNVNLKKIDNDPYFEVIELPGQIDLQQFSKLAKLDMPTIQHLNAGHLRWATSPDGPHRLLVPLTNHVNSAFALQQIKINPSIEYKNHTIARGETLSQIGRRYGVGVSALQTANNLNGTSIRTGKNLVIPIASRKTSLVAQESSTQEDQNNKRIHHVVKGDTLWSISKRYNVDLKSLLSWNQLSKNQILKLNQPLLIFLN